MKIKKRTKEKKGRIPDQRSKGSEKGMRYLVIDSKGFQMIFQESFNEIITSIFQ